MMPPPEMEAAAELLDAAADALVDGRLDDAAALLLKANMLSLWLYADLTMNAHTSLRKRLRRTGGGIVSLPNSERYSTRMPSMAVQVTIFERDGYRCRYCGCRVVLKQARSILTSHFPEVVPWPGGPYGDGLKHAAFFALNSVVDHVAPHSQGGNDSLENLVTACWPCNFGKHDYRLDELGLTDPRSRPPVVDKWDGLARILPLRLPRSAKSTAVLVRPSQQSDNRPAPKPAAVSDRQRLLDWLTPSEQISRVQAERLFDFLMSTVGDRVSLSVNKRVLLNVHVAGKTLAVFGIDQAGNVDVPWGVNGEKARLKPFAFALAAAIPGARLYEANKMWRVDGRGDGMGQITVEELLGAADVIAESIKDLIVQDIETAPQVF